MSAENTSALFQIWLQVPQRLQVQKLSLSHPLEFGSVWWCDVRVFT